MKVQVTKLLLCLIAVISISSCKKESSKASGMPAEYKMITIDYGNKTLYNKFPVTIKGRQDIEIRPQISGLITGVKVKEGESVKKGQVLFVIDQVAYRAALENAVANVEMAKANVETAKLNAESKQELFSHNIISDYELKTAVNSLKNAEAVLAQAKAQEINARNDLSFTEIKSPSDGRIGMIPYRIGALVNSGISTPLTTVSDNEEMYVYFSVPEKHIIALSQKNGSLENTIASMPEVRLQLGDDSVYENPGYIETISGIIDTNTGSVSLRAVFPNREKILMSGGTGKIIIPQTIDNCIVIPKRYTEK